MPDAPVDLAAWLRAQLDEDESALKGLNVIDRGPWRVIEWYDGEFDRDGHTKHVDLHGRTGSITANGALPRPVAAHIARWDPARVLAEIDAKRRLLDFAFEYAADLDGEWGDGHTAEQIRAGECDDHYGQRFMDVLRPLAAPFAGRPSWLDEWALPQ